MFRQPTLESMPAGSVPTSTPTAAPAPGSPPKAQDSLPAGVVAGGDGVPAGGAASAQCGIAEDGFGVLLGELPPGAVDGDLQGDLDGVHTGEPVTRYTFTNKNGLSVQVINYGVTVTSIVVPDRNGVFDDIALGFDDFQGYLSNASYFLGSTVGRVAGVVSRARFSLDGRVFELSVDADNVHRHGGLKGFAKVVWRSSVCGDHVVFTHLSADGEDGYPGNLLVTIKMSLGEDNALRTLVTATSDRPTPVNIGNHTCFNLAGHMHGPAEVGNHVVVLNSDKWLCADDDGVPTGEIKHVGCTLMDLRVHRVLARLTPLVPLGGFDHTFLVNGARQDGVRFVGRLLHPKSGRVLEVFSDQPAVHLYTGKDLGYPYVEEPVDEEALAAAAALAASMDNQVGSEPAELDLPAEDAVEEPPLEQLVDADVPAEGAEPAEGDDDVRSVNLEVLEPLADEPEVGPKKPEMLGKGGALYEKNGCFSLMTQGYTDAVNKHHFPDILVRPGETYTHTTVLKFAVCVKSRKYAAEALAQSPPEQEPSEPSEPGSRHSGDSRRSDGTRDEAPYAPFEEEEAPPAAEDLAEPVPVEQ